MISGSGYESDYSNMFVVRWNLLSFSCYDLVDCYGLNELRFELVRGISVILVMFILGGCKVSFSLWKIIVYFEEEIFRF